MCGFPWLFTRTGTVAPVVRVAKVEAIHRYPVPKDEQRFLGMVGYYCKFCHNFATIATPLTELRTPEKAVYVNSKLSGCF